MNLHQLTWLVIVLALLIPIGFFFQRWRLAKRSGTKYKDEMLPGLGKVQAVYQDGKLASYEFEKDGVNFSVNCFYPDKIQSALEEAKTFIPAKIGHHLQQAIKAVPQEELKVWGFDKGKWKMESIFINGKDDLVLELGNSHDQDHCCRIIFENGKYEFESVDG